MLRTMQTLLALICLLLLAWMAARADGAPWQDTDPAWQPSVAQPAFYAEPRPLPVHRCLVPSPQPGTHLQGQPFAYGYFGARAETTPVFHRNYRGDWFQWSFRRGD